MDKPLDKEAIRKALEAASPGPWVPYWDGVVQFFNVPNGAYMFPADDFEREDAHLITHAPTWIRALLEENEQLQTVLSEEIESNAHKESLFLHLQNEKLERRRLERDFEGLNRMRIQAEQEREKYYKLAAELATEQKYAKEQAIKWNDRAIQAKQELDALRAMVDGLADKIIDVQRFADTEELNFPLENPTAEEQSEWFDTFIDLLEQHVRGVIDDELADIHGLAQYSKGDTP